MEKHTLCRGLPQHARWVKRIFTLLAAGFLTAGCAAVSGKTHVNDQPADTKDKVMQGTILDTKTGGELTFSQLIDALEKVQIVYVGESHTAVAHHEIQYRVLEALADRHADLTVGMEMFARPYQPVLHRWSRGELTADRFRKATHWYANWRYPYDLYQQILDFVRKRNIPLYALNIPFHIPPKIAVGGLESLLPDEIKHLPQEIDLTTVAHREYVKEIFDSHRHFARGRDNFEFFYQAQCVWEDVMAEAVAQHRGGRPMLVLIGNGHIIHKFGVPDRAHRRTGVSYRTLIPTQDPEAPRKRIADYIWRLPGDPPAAGEDDS